MFDKEFMKLIRKQSWYGQVVAEFAIIIMILIVVAAAGVYGWQTTIANQAEVTAVQFPRWRFSNHSLKKQLIDGWNVMNLSLYMSQGECTPIVVYTCSNDIVKFTCPVRKGETGRKALWAGLIIGHDTFDQSQVVITVIIAPLKRWEAMGLRDGCTSSTLIIPPTMMLPAP
jgi:hypothetical protein